MTAALTISPVHAFNALGSGRLGFGRALRVMLVSGVVLVGLAVLSAATLT